MSRNHVVKMTLRGVEPAGAADAPARFEEVPGGGLVRPDLLRCHDQVERDREMAPRLAPEATVQRVVPARPRTSFLVVLLRALAAFAA